MLVTSEKSPEQPGLGELLRTYKFLILYIAAIVTLQIILAVVFHVT